MRYRKLGNTGLIVSSVALGTMQFGGKMNMANLGQEDTTRMVKLALDRGINFFDAADVYSLGESQTLVGNAFKGVRDEIVLATKVRLSMNENFNRSGATRANINREVEGSLRRLQTDYIDLYQMHGYSNTPLEVEKTDYALVINSQGRVGGGRDHNQIGRPCHTAVRRLPQMGGVDAILVIAPGDINHASVGGFDRNRDGPPGALLAQESTKVESRILHHAFFPTSCRYCCSAPNGGCRFPNCRRVRRQCQLCHSVSTAHSLLNPEN
jgi:hypothetical protein